MILKPTEVSKVFLDEAINGVGEKDENIIEARDRWTTPLFRKVLNEHWLDGIWHGVGKFPAGSAKQAVKLMLATTSHNLHLNRITYLGKGRILVLRCGA